MKYFFYLLLSILFSCKSLDCPSKHTDLSDRKYEQYCNKLKEARSKKDCFGEGTALCNLKQPPTKVYKLLNKSIKQHDTLCYQIYDYQYLHKSGSLTVSIIKADTLMWRKLCAKCEKIVPIEKYYEKKNNEELAYKKKKAILENKLDTNLLDKNLMALLSEIIKKDQSIRGIPFMDNKNPKWKEQKYLDSLNLIQIDNIFKTENGYPSMEKVGYDMVSVPWYVLQHQSSAMVRRKYQPFLEEAAKKNYLSKSMLDNFKDRTLTIEEYEKQKKQ